MSTGLRQNLYENRQKRALKKETSNGSLQTAGFFAISIFTDRRKPEIYQSLRLYFSFKPGAQALYRNQLG
jgi:hypothetical protein